MSPRLAGICALISVALAATGCREGLEVARLESGGQAFLAQCAVCHGVRGAGDGPLAASIVAEGRTPPARLDAQRVDSLGRAGVRLAIEGSAHARQGSPMPIWGPHLGPEWMDRIAEYVVAMPAMGEAGRNRVDRYLAAPAGTPPTGRGVYVMYCSSCHGPYGVGDGMFSPEMASRMKSPRIAGAALSRFDDDRLSQLIQAGGAHAADAVTMPGWLYTIPPDERKALVGYLRSLAGTAKPGD
jgi:mono/diheme cytochrome c family protein